MTDISNKSISVGIPINLKITYMALMDKYHYNIIFKTELDIQENCSADL